MRFVSGLLKSAIAFFLAGVLAIDASAGVVVNFAQVGNDVVASLSGSIENLGTPNFSNNLASNLQSFIYSDLTFSDKGIRVARPGYTASTYNSFSLTTSNQYWGPTVPFKVASSSNITGVDYLDVWGGGSRLSLASNYVFGTSISGTITWSNKSLADIGITNLGTFGFTLGSGANTDTITLNMTAGGGQVPEPSTMAIFGLGTLGMVYRARRKANA